jgi:GAF domain-containing protein
LPLDEAMAKVVADSGKSFDPKVVEILHRRYIELEKLATEEPSQSPPKLSTDIKVIRGDAPDAGFAESGGPTANEAMSSASSGSRISAARQQGREVADISRASDAAIKTTDIFSLLCVRLKKLVPHEAMAVYCPQGDDLVPEFVSGENFRLFSSLRIPLGEGLSGWVAQNHKAIVNGNPSVEPGYLNDPERYSTLRSALAVPIEGMNGIIAVLALYRGQQDAFTAEDLQVVEVIGGEVAKAVEFAAKPKAAKAAAGTD